MTQPTGIQAVLDLLPKLFPGIQEIPLANIRPNPKNPGPALTEEEVADLAENMAERGLVNPLKLRLDKESPLVAGLQTHPDNPRLTAGGRPWAITDFRFMILAGERRFRAAGKLQWAAIQAFVFNPTEAEAVEITHLDNDVRNRGWWAAYQSIEQLIQADPSLTQRQVGARLKIDPTRVSKALRLLPLLNRASRDLIVGNSYNSNKGIWGISESVALRLADLGPGGVLKPGVRKEGEGAQWLWPYPAIPTRTQDLVSRALKKAIDLELTEAGVKALVDWVKSGHMPESYQANREEEEEEEVEEIPWSENVKHHDYMAVPVDRVRVNSFIEASYSFSMARHLEKAVLSMKLTGLARDIAVRRLSEMEKAADPEHDFELFMGPVELKAAQRLGWPTLQATVYDIDEWEGVRLHYFVSKTSHPLTWIQDYNWIAKQLVAFPDKNLEYWTVAAELDFDLVEKVLPLMKLLNAPTQEAIHKSVRQCFEGATDNGGHRFYPEFALLLAPFGNSKDLAQTQKQVEKLVKVAIENEMYEEDLKELVDWTLAGNDPREFYETAGQEA